MELAVGEIAQVVGESQPRVSRHVRILVEAGLAERRKEGSWVFLRLGQDAHIAPLTRFLDGAELSDSEALWMKADLARLAAVRNDRAQAAEHYFAEHARSEEHTSELQSLMRISYAVFCLKKKNKHKRSYTTPLTTQHTH